MIWPDDNAGCGGVLFYLFVGGVVIGLLLLAAHCAGS